MPNVVAVRFRYNTKQLWFDPGTLVPQAGDHLIVETDRGTEIGLAAGEPFEVSDKEIAELPTPLKPVLRIANEKDFAHVEELALKNDEAMPLFRQLANKYKLDMKPIAVEHLFGGEKVVFYFASEERVDFREFVRELASKFHMRIDMRQIGVRDEARYVGGISHCGEELCCTRLGGEFQPVSIRMAKEQGLPLNPLKISGLCGRLMCCLRYEFEAYKDFKERAPKRGALVETPLGLAKVVDFNTPLEVITIRLEDGKSLSVPLDKMDCCSQKSCGEGKTCSCSVSREVLEECAGTAITLALSSLDREKEREELKDETLKRTVRRRNVRDSKDTRAPKDSRAPKAAAETDAGKSEAQKQGEQKSPTPRKRRRPAQSDSAQNSQKGTPATERGTEGKKQRANTNDVATGKETQKSRPRPGQHSSGIRAGASDNAGGTGKGNAESRRSAPQPDSAPRRRPRRRHTGGSEPKEG